MTGEGPEHTTWQESVGAYVLRALPEDEEMDFDAEVSVEGYVIERDRAGVVREALGDLPGEQSKVIELAYFGGFTHTEIADMLGLPVGTVKGRMRLGLTKLRTRFEPMGEAIT